jgi:hypothetical protein
MNVLGYLLLLVGAFVLFVVVGTFFSIMFSVVLDVMSEREQARERDKRRE